MASWILQIRESQRASSLATDSAISCCSDEGGTQTVVFCTIGTLMLICAVPTPRRRTAAAQRVRLANSRSTLLSWPLATRDTTV